MKDRRPGVRAVIINDELFPFRLPFFRALNRPQLQVHCLVLSRPRYRRWRLPEDPGVSLEFLPGPTIHLTKPSLGERRNIHLPMTLAWKLSRLRPDVVVAYAFSVATWIATVYCRLFKVPLVVWSEGTAHTESEISRLQLVARRWVIRSTRAMLAGSEAAVKRLVELGAPPEHVLSIAHVADTSDFTQSDRVAWQTKLRLLYVGALSKLKGTDHLLEIFMRVHAELPEASLTIVGDGPMRAWVEQRINQLGLSDAVFLRGFVQPNDLPEVYAQASVFVFPTLRDTFAQVLAEAVASGLPVVTSPFAGAVGDLVVDGRNGFVRDPKDHAAFAGVVLSLLRRPEIRVGMGEESRRVAQVKTPQLSADATASLLTTVARLGPGQLKSTSSVGGC